MTDDKRAIPLPRPNNKTKKIVRKKMPTWVVRGPKGVENIIAESEIIAVDLYFKMYGVIPTSAKRFFKPKDHLTSKPFRISQLEDLKKKLEKKD